MDLTVVFDFADPLSFLASQRIEKITSLGLHRATWLAVEANRIAPMSGRPVSPETADALTALRLAGEIVPSAGTRMPNSRAATAAYAESLSDDAADAMRRALFDAIWMSQLRVENPDVIRGLVIDVLNPNPPGDIEARIRSNSPIVPLGDPDPFTATRRLGLIVSMAGGPMTHAGHLRIQQWRSLWQQNAEPVLPLLMIDTGDTFAGTEALDWLADQLPSCVDLGQTTQALGVCGVLSTGRAAG